MRLPINKKAHFLIYLSVLACFVIVLNAFKFKENKTEQSFTNKNEHTIILKWNKAYPTDTKAFAETGLLWALSFLGAELPQGSFAKSTKWNKEKLHLNLSKVGFNENSLNAFSQLVIELKKSEEYKLNGAIDLGRFIALTINSSNHYYAITGISKTLGEFKQNKVFDQKQFAATNSSITTTDRIIDLPDSTLTDFAKMAYISNECVGRIKNGESSIYEYEVKEQLVNGQFRFAVYDSLGMLVNAARKNSGKPAKCLWCHESNIQPLITKQMDEPGFYTSNFFEYIIAKNLSTLKNYRIKLKSDIDYIKKQDHTYMELLYISFMEPSAERIALEWNMNINKVKKLLSNLTTHKHEEFEMLGDLYNRNEIEQLAPYKSIKPPSNAREKSEYEPDLIK